MLRFASKKLMLKVLTEADYKENDKELSTYLVACFRLITQLTCFQIVGVEKWIVFVWVCAQMQKNVET